MRNRPVLTGNLPPLMPAFDSNASTHNIKTERVLAATLNEHTRLIIAGTAWFYENLSG